MKRALKYAIPVAAIIAQGIDEPATAGDLFLKVEGIDGESTSQNHEGEIDVLAWSWGVSNGVDVDLIIGGGGGGGAKTSFAPIKIIKSVDAASAELILLAAAGDNISTATLTATRPGPKGGPEEDFMKLTLDQLFVTKVAHGGKDSEDGVAETITLDYTKIKVEHRSISVKTGTWGAWEETCWDRSTGKSC